VIEKDKMSIKGKNVPKDKSHFVDGKSAEDTVKGNIGDKKPVSNIRLFSDEEMKKLGVFRFGLEDIEYDLPPTKEHQKMIEDGLQDEAGKKLMAKAKDNSQRRAKIATKTTQLGSDIEFNTNDQTAGFTRKTFNETVEYHFPTPFQTSNHMYFLIPEEAKIDGNKFVMADGLFENVIIWDGDRESGIPILRESGDLRIKKAIDNIVIETAKDVKSVRGNETQKLKEFIKAMR